MFSFVDAVNAVASGSCDHVLVVYPFLRLPWASRQAANDPFRRHLQTGMAAFPESIANAAGYAAWASRYLYEYGASRDTFARIAINQRTNAAQNPLAAIQTPLTMEDYLRGPHDPRAAVHARHGPPRRRRRRVRAHHRRTRA